MSCFVQCALAPISVHTYVYVLCISVHNVSLEIRHYSCYFQISLKNTNIIFNKHRNTVKSVPVSLRYFFICYFDM